MKQRDERDDHVGQVSFPFARAVGRKGKKRGPKRRVFGRVLHRARPIHKGRHPVHVTLRARHGLPSFRQQLVHALLLRVLRDQRRRAYGETFQIVHFSIQSNHVHMIVEADDDGPRGSVAVPSAAFSASRKATRGPADAGRDAASRERSVTARARSPRNPLRSGVSGFVIAFAKRLNALLKRKGKVWDDRYHRHDLESPHEVKTSVRYVINNFRKHGDVTFGAGAYDYYSSAQHFDGWSEPLFAYFAEPEPWTEAPPRTYLLAKGWKRWGPISPMETPGIQTKRSL